jgi:hypothetical protein
VKVFGVISEPVWVELADGEKCETILVGAFVCDNKIIAKSMFRNRHIKLIPNIAEVKTIVKQVDTSTISDCIDITDTVDQNFWDAFDEAMTRMADEIDSGRE